MEFLSPLSVKRNVKRGENVEHHKAVSHQQRTSSHKVWNKDAHFSLTLGGEEVHGLCLTVSFEKICEILHSPSCDPSYFAGIGFQLPKCLII